MKVSERLSSVLRLSGEARGRLVPADWVPLERALRLSVPKDYKSFVRIYGAGVIDEFLWPFSPNSVNQNLDLMTQINRQASVLRTIREKSVTDVPFPIFPETGGLLVWGISDNGDTLHWLTAGSPEHWPTIVFEARGPRWIRFNLVATELIVGLLTKRIRCPLFPADFPSERPSFRAA